VHFKSEFVYIKVIGAVLVENINADVCDFRDHAVINIGQRLNIRGVGAS
jgi:hypothetical protein